MDPVFIDRLEAKNYGCLTDVSVELTPLHALVGPNDSGKSTILRAVRVLTQYLEQSSKPGQVMDLSDLGLDPERNVQLSLKMGLASLELGAAPPPKGWTVTFAMGEKRVRVNEPEFPSGLSLLHAEPEFTQWVKAISPIFRGPRVLRLDPDSLRQESQLIPEKEPISFFRDRGLGLAGVYDAIQNRGDDSFRDISERVRGLFPTIKALRLRNVNRNTKALELELWNGARVPAPFMSEGLLYYLAIASLPYLEQAAVVLVEEPENGLHPIRIAEVMKVFREIAQTTQVIIATHSPLVVNELSPHEVSVVTRTSEHGTSVRRLSSVPNFQDRSKVYALGEMWLSYANGVDESPLFAAQRSS